MKKIKLTQGKYALVDDSDFEKLSKFKWYADRGVKGVFYACRTSRAIEGKVRKIRMTSMIMSVPIGKQVDHIDSNGLNNQRKNLRICSSSENAMNRRTSIRNSSGLKGVSRNKNNDKWRTHIQVGKKDIYLGTYISKLRAYEVYCIACRKYHKEFSRVI